MDLWLFFYRLAAVATPAIEQKKWPSIFCLAIVFMKQHQVVSRYQRLVLVLVLLLELQVLLE